MPIEQGKWDDPLRHAAETRGTVAILCSAAEKDAIAAAARKVALRYGIEPQLDPAPASGMRIGYRPPGSEGQPPVT